MTSNNLALNRVFNQRVFRDLINEKSNHVFAGCVNRYIHSRHCSNHELIRNLYNYLAKNYRNEYFYKNTLLNKLLLGRHSLNTTTALAELPINRSKADFILINGHATVYEIKTELDSFDRLESQINDYHRVFNNVCVVAAESSAKKLNQMLKDTNVGICVITKRNNISERKPTLEDNRHLDHTSMFKVLRKKEYETILLSHFGYLPHTTQVKYYRECLHLFRAIDLMVAHGYLLKELKKRTIKEKEAFKQVPYELKFLTYFSDFRATDYKKLQHFLNKEGGN